MTRLRLYFRRLCLRLATWWALRRLGLRVGQPARLLLDPARKPLDRPVWYRIGGVGYPPGPASIACTVRGLVGQSVKVEVFGRCVRVAPCRLEAAAEAPLPKPTRGHAWWRLSDE